MSTGKTRSQEFDLPVGHAIVAILCSFARTGLSVREVRQASNGCMLISTIPSGINNFEGDLLINVTKRAKGTGVSATARIPGQIYDSGKCKKCLNQLFTDINTHPGI
jgi:hypothetical protein